jgi:hypothetical protein
MSALKITIPKPCMVSRSTMTDTSVGKYCSNCQKEVIDFSNMPNEELYYFFKNTKEIPCGSFLPSQLNTLIKPTLAPHYYVKIRTHIAAALLLLLMLQASPSIALPLQPVRKEMIGTKPKPNVGGNNVVTITGHVVDDHGKNMQDVEISFGNFAKTTTDSLGKFSFEYNIVTGNGFLIGFAFEGFNSFARNYNSAMGSTHYEVELVKRGIENHNYPIQGGIGMRGEDVIDLILFYNANDIKLNNDLKAQLDELSSQMKAAGDVNIKIITGINKTAKSISVAKQRQKSIISYLVNSKGIGKSRLSVENLDGVDINSVEIIAE